MSPSTLHEVWSRLTLEQQDETTQDVSERSLRRDQLPLSLFLRVVEELETGRVGAEGSISTPLLSRTKRPQALAFMDTFPFLLFTQQDFYTFFRRVYGMELDAYLASLAPASTSRGNTPPRSTLIHHAPPASAPPLTPPPVSDPFRASVETVSKSLQEAEPISTPPRHQSRVASTSSCLSEELPIRRPPTLFNVERCRLLETIAGLEAERTEAHAEIRQITEAHRVLTRKHAELIENTDMEILRMRWPLGAELPAEVLEKEDATTARSPSHHPRIVHQASTADASITLPPPDTPLRLPVQQLEALGVLIEEQALLINRLALVPPTPNMNTGVFNSVSLPPRTKTSLCVSFGALLGTAIVLMVLARLGYTLPVYLCRFRSFERFYWYLHDWRYWLAWSHTHETLLGVLRGN